MHFKPLNESLTKKCDELSLDETKIGIVYKLETEDFENVKHLQLQNSIGFTDLVKRKVFFLFMERNVEFPNLTTLGVHGRHELIIFVRLAQLQISTCQLLDSVMEIRLVFHRWKNM